MVGAAAMAVTEAFTLLYAWWATPISTAMGLGGSASVFAGGRLSPLTFATHGITPLGYAAFGFVLGVTAGVLVRRAVPAMAVTLAIFVAVQVVMPLWLRPHIIPPARTIVTAESSQARSPASGGLAASVVPGQPGAWIISSGAVNVSGQPVAAIPAACIPTEGTPGAPRSGSQTEAGLSQCLEGDGIRVAISYQPASRYWALQGIETGIFLVLALALSGFCLRRLGRRKS